jgi:NADH-quinone oxidoreductase subunit J
MVEQVLFYLFSLVLVTSAFAVITLRNPVHSVLFLILAFFNAAGLFVMLGAEFLAMLLVIVYVGAVAVLFLFVVMMLNVTAEKFREGLTRYFPAGCAVAALMLAQMVFLFTNLQKFGKEGTIISAPNNAGITNTENLGLIIYTDYMFAFQASGIILLIAMIGAIVLTFNKRDRMRKQTIGAQVARSSKTAIEVVKVETGKGI